MNNTAFRHRFVRMAFAAAAVLALGRVQQVLADDASPEVDADEETAGEDSWLEKSNVVDDEESKFLSGDSELGPDADMDSEEDSFVTSSFSYLTEETAFTKFGDGDDSDVSPVEWSAGIDVHKNNDTAKEVKKPSVAPKGDKVAGAPADAIVDLGGMDSEPSVAEQHSADSPELPSPDTSAKSSVADGAATVSETSTESVAEAEAEQEAPGSVGAVTVTNVTEVATAEGAAAPVEENSAAATSSGGEHDGAVTGSIQDPAAAKEEAKKAASEEIHGQRHDESSEFQRMMR